MKTILNSESLGERLFFLNSKRLTLLLGTFVPFFCCHIYALTILTLGRHKEDLDFVDANKKEALSYVLFFLFGALIISLVYFPSFCGLNSGNYTFPSKIVLILLLSIITGLTNFAVSAFYYKIYSKVFVPAPEEEKNMS